MNNLNTNKSLLVLQFNANDLKNYIDELRNVLYDKRIGIALITNTFYQILKFIYTDIN